MEFRLREKLTILFMLSAISLSLFAACDNWFNQQIKRIATENSRRNIDALHRIAARTEKKLFLTRKILPVLRKTVENNADINLIQSYFAEKFGIDLNIYRFSAAGKLVETAPRQATNLWLMRNLYPAISEKNLDKIPPLAKNLDKKIQFAFGFGKDLVSIRENEERIIQTFFDNQEGILAWTARDKGGVIIYSSTLPDPDRIFLGEAISLKRPANLVKTGIISETGAGGNVAQRAYQHVVEKNQQHGTFAGQYWAFIKAASGRIYFACFSIPTCRLTRFMFLFRTLIAVLTMTSLAFFILSSKALSLKFLLISMFAAASLIPLGGIAFTSYENLDVFEQIEARKIRAIQEETLGNIAQNFSAYLSSCSDELMKLTQEPGKGGNDPRTARMSEEIRARFPEARVTVRNAGAERLYYYGPMISQGRETVFKSLARKLIERYAPDRLSEQKYNGNLFSDSMVNKDDMGFSTLLNYPNMLQMVSTGNADLLLFYRMLPKSAGDAAIVVVELSTYPTMKRYLQSFNPKRFSADQVNMQISAFFPDGYRWSLPPSFQSEQPLLRLAEEVWLSGQSKFQKYSDHLSGYALAIPFASLSGKCLIAFCSDEHILQNLDKMKSRFFFGAAIALMILVSIVVWLSRQLISPLKHLSRGVDALAQRKFETRLPEPPGEDEMAQLFKAFNEMMAESYDMQIAKNVQEGLVPQEFPSIPGYSLHGLLREASELGGDCLDCFMISNTRMLFLIGDITGHGVGSALIMAFSRAVTFHWSQSEKNLSPTTLADQLDFMLRKNQTRRMFMGIICGVLDTEKQQIELVVKGHIYPLLLKADGGKKWVGTPAYPLGIGKMTPASSMFIDFRPGDRLLCITDGILESRFAGKTLGFEGIEKWAGEIGTFDAKDFTTELENRYMSWTRHNQHDDISIFAVCGNRELTDEKQ